MNIHEMQQAVRDAKNTLSSADSQAEDMARILIGRLKKVGNSHILSTLKKELRTWNIHTGQWMDQQ